MSAESKPGMKLWLKLLLAGSLALNLAVIGLAAGAVWRFSDKDKHWKRPPPVGALIFKELEPGTRMALRQEAGGTHGSYVKRRRAESEAVLKTLRSEEFDAGALLMLLQGQSDARHAFHTKVQKAWVQKLEGMTPAQRAELADRLEERMQHRGGGWRGGKHN